MSKNNRLKEVLDARGIKYVWVCEQTGISKSALNELIQKRREPTLATARKIARALGMPLEEIWPED